MRSMKKNQQIKEIRKRHVDVTEPYKLPIWIVGWLLIKLFSSLCWFDEDWGIICFSLSFRIEKGIIIEKCVRGNQHIYITPPLPSSQDSSYSNPSCLRVIPTASGYPPPISPASQILSNPNPTLKNNSPFPINPITPPSHPLINTRLLVTNNPEEWHSNRLSLSKEILKRKLPTPCARK